MASKRLVRFKSPRKALCTCPPKYNINPYLGRCAHGCVYCYAVKFPSFNGPLKPRLDLVESIEDVVKNTRTRLPVMLSDSTDPYQPVEKTYKITRSCLQALAKHSFPILIVTKSDMVTRDLGILEQSRAVIAITVTSINERFAKLFEPYAPPPERRLRALEAAAERGLNVVARIDPIVPGLNDDESFESLVVALKDMGVKQVTISTLKPVRGFFSKLDQVTPTLSRSLRRLYADSQWMMGYRYLPPEVRFRVIRRLMSVVVRHGLRFASCREGCPEFNTSICDGTSYCRTETDLSSYMRSGLGASSHE